ncbi:MAG: SUMF1/EgtB/PvdO family nonheme iron enzyme [Pirellulales bacterium]
MAKRTVNQEVTVVMPRIGWFSFIRFVILTLALTCLAGVVSAQEDEGAVEAAAAQVSGDKWALLIGVDDYANLGDLQYCGADMRSMRERLIKAGFAADHVFLLHDQAEETRYRPSRLNIERQLEVVLALPEKEDLLVVAFSGHGVRAGDTSYLCPTEADVADPRTLLSLDELYQRLTRSGAGFRLAIIDACRNDPQARGQRAARASSGMNEFSNSLGEHPAGVLMLTSCQPGQIAWEEQNEDSQFQGGVFTHYLLEGLDGSADQAGDRDGTVTLSEWVHYASERTKTYVARQFNALQKPTFVGALAIDALDFPLGQMLASNEAEIPLPPMDEPGPAPAAPAAPSFPAQLGSIDDPAIMIPLPDNVVQTHTNTIGMRLRLIPAGEFTMGSNEYRAALANDFELNEKFDPSDEGPAHRVRITRPFLIGQYEVTRGQFAAFVEATQYKTDAERDGQGGWGWVDAKVGGEQRPNFNWHSWGVNQSDRSPVINVSYNDACKFCEWLSQKEGVSYRLPTEAQWEYVCRAGTKTRFYNGDDPRRLIEIGNVADETAKDRFTWWKFVVPGRDGWEFTAPIGHYQPNNFRVFDMIGNALEWCRDWYGETYYETSPSEDPQGPDQGQVHCVRGGGWTTFPVFCRAAARDYRSAEFRQNNLGFRVVVEP